MHDQPSADQPADQLGPDLQPLADQVAALWQQVEAAAAELQRRREVTMFLLEQEALEVEDLRARRDLAAAEAVDALAAAGISQRALARRLGVLPGSLAHVVARGRRQRRLTDAVHDLDEQHDGRDEQ